MKITSKGQVTIPSPIRRELGLRPGTEVEFVVEGGKLILRRRKKADPVEAWLEEATGVARGKTTTSRIMKFTREHWRANWG